MAGGIEVRYVCAGSCGGWVTEAQYNSGKTSCGAKACPMYKHEFKKMSHCKICGAVFEPGARHEHKKP